MWAAIATLSVVIVLMAFSLWHEQMVKRKLRKNRDEWQNTAEYHKEKSAAASEREKELSRLLGIADVKQHMDIKTRGEMLQLDTLLSKIGVLCSEAEAITTYYERQESKNKRNEHE